MRATGKGFGAEGRRGHRKACALLAALASMLLLAPAGAGAVSFEYTLDCVGVSTCGSNMQLWSNGASQVGYTPGTVLELTVDAPDLASISAGDTITLENFFLPDTTIAVDLGFSQFVNVWLGLSLDGGFPDIQDDSPGPLETTLFSVGGGRLGAIFPSFDIFWYGEDPGGNPATGVIPFVLQTTQVTINTSSTNPELPGVGCDMTQSLQVPVFPMPNGGSTFADGSRFVLGGGTCPTGFRALNTFPETAFTIELQGVIATPEPGTLLLVSSGLAGLAALGRRRPRA